MHRAKNNTLYRSQWECCQQNKRRLNEPFTILFQVLLLTALRSASQLRSSFTVENAHGQNKLHILSIYIYTVCIVYRLAHQNPKQFGLTNGSLKLWPIFLASRGRVPSRQQLSPQSGRMPPATVLYWCLLSSESETTNKLTIQVIRSQHRHSHCGFWLCFAVKNLASLSAQPKGLPHVC